MGNSSSSSSSSNDSNSNNNEEGKSTSKKSSTGLHYKTIQDAVAEEKIPITSMGRRLAVTRPDQTTTINTHKQSPLRKGDAIPSSLTQEQAEILAEIDPHALKAAVDMDAKKKRMRYMVIDTFEIDSTWALIAAGIVGLIAVPITKYAVDNTEVNRVYYEESKATRTHSVFTVTPTKEKPKPNPVAGNTFQSIVASGKNLPIAHALEKIRAQQLRLGFFSIWRGTGAELIWFLTSCSSALAFQSFADRIWNREWYNALARFKKQQKIIKRKDELAKSGADPTEDDRKLLEAADQSFDKPFAEMLPAGANMKLHPDHRWNHYYTTRRAVIENTATGAAAGVLSVLSTYHAEIVASKCVEDYQNSIKRGSKRQFNGMMDCYVKTHQQHGLASLYFGVGPVFLRAAAFWGLTFGMRGSMHGLWGYLSHNDYVRMMKRQHFDLPSDAVNAREAVAGLLHPDNSSFRNFSDSKIMKYNGEEYSVMPVFFDFWLTTGSAAVARDAGALVVKQMVFAKSAMQHLFSTSYARMRNSGGLQPGEGGSLARDAFEFGRSTASTCPKRLPFSCLRIGVIVSVFDAFRAGHARRWCTKVREDEIEEKFGMSPKKMKAKEEAAAQAAEAAADARSGRKLPVAVSIFPQSSKDGKNN